MHHTRKIWVALPAMNEASWLPATIEAIQAQQHVFFEVVVCVNQAEAFCFSRDQQKRQIFRNNQHTLSYLKAIKDLPLTILDKSSRGKGWPEKKAGVGAARKHIMDYIANKAKPEDIILSLDADTLADRFYFASVCHIFDKYPGIAGHSNPYYHKLCGNDTTDRAILRYEIYMRNYSVNMNRINNPYRFTALGSAMATTAGIYQRIGGLTAKNSGEDFYFLQKLLKTGPLCLHNTALVYPAARLSHRVSFGTGPAMIKGIRGDWASYPLYDAGFFDRIKETFRAFPKLYSSEIETPMDDTLNMPEKNIWAKLRKNSRSATQFEKACRQNVDGLRILQFLKASQKTSQKTECETLSENLKLHNIKPDNALSEMLDTHSGLMECSTVELAKIRDLLYHKERTYQINNPITTL
ncbi:MAG: hypothetical protein R6U19_07375 [Bacteroidales bacterium]